MRLSHIALMDVSASCACACLEHTLHCPCTGGLCTTKKVPTLFCKKTLLLASLWYFPKEGSIAAKSTFAGDVKLQIRKDDITIRKQAVLTRTHPLRLMLLKEILVHFHCNLSGKKELSPRGFFGFGFFAPPQKKQTPNDNPFSQVSMEQPTSLECSNRRKQRHTCV